MASNSASSSSFAQVPKHSQIYEDEIMSEEIKRKAKFDPELLEAYRKANQSARTWADEKTEEYRHDNEDKEDLKLCNMYAMKDYFVKRTNETDLQVQGGKIDVTFHPVFETERIRMSKKYKNVHLDGIEINCESLMPRGSEGFAIFSLYDERFVSHEKGFLGLAGFPLSKSVSKASFKINYSISTLDKINWIAIITVYDHQLKDGMRPCNFHIKSFYKYTNNLSRFFKTDNETEVGKFKIEIVSDNKEFAIESIRNSLDYSRSVLLNKTFMKTLSDRERNCLGRMSLSESPNKRQIQMQTDSCLTSKPRLSVDSHQKRKDILIDFEKGNPSIEEQKKMLLEKLSSLECSSSSTKVYKPIEL